MWFYDLVLNPTGVMHSVFVASLAAATGLALGTLSIRGVSLGISGCLFSGIILSYLGLTIDNATLSFLRDFGLILFVYTVGLQVGPSFVSSLKSQGLVLNLLAITVVVLGAALVLGVFWLGHVSPPAALGIFAGASGNMPALGAAQSVVSGLVGPTAPEVNEPSLSCAVTYPFGVMGVILAEIVLKHLLHVNPDGAAQSYAAEHQSGAQTLETMNIEVTNLNFNGLPLQEILASVQARLAVSRIRKAVTGTIVLARPSTVVDAGDMILAIGDRTALMKLQRVIGRVSSLDLKTLPSAHASRRIVVTMKRLAGRPVNELKFVQNQEALITRIARGEVEFTPTSNVRLQYGDVLTVVGTDEALLAAERELGNSVGALGHPQVIPIFVGLAVGLFIGSIPLPIPGVPIPIKLGLAGGPLVVAIIFSTIRHVGPLVWYMPMSSNMVLREIGIVLFLTCVGLASGPAFFSTLASSAGLEWLAWGAFITLTPLLLVALIAHFFLKMNFLVMAGLLSGSMTNPPALSFSNSLANSDAPAVAYTTVYPLTMILRVFLAQALALIMLAR